MAVLAGGRYAITSTLWGQTYRVDIPILAEQIIPSATQTSIKVLSSKLWFVCLASALLFLGVLGSTQFVYPHEAKSRNSGIEIVAVQGNISMLAGAGGN